MPDNRSMLVLAGVASLAGAVIEASQRQLRMSPKAADALKQNEMSLTKEGNQYTIEQPSRQRHRYLMRQQKKKFNAHKRKKY